MAAKKKTTTKKQREVKPTRYLALRTDSTIGSAEKTIERIFKLPSGSVRLVHPSKKKMRSDATVQTLLAKWAE